MLTPQQVENLIENVTECEYVEIGGDGHHFSTVITSPAFEGETRLAHHRPIKDGLKTHLQNNKSHTLSISVAVTPAEWAAEQ